MPRILSIIESALHPDCAGLYRELGLVETRVDSMRKALHEIKRAADRPFDFIVCEFAYGYGNDYAGVTVSNLDVMLASLQKYAPGTRVIAVAEKSELQYVDKLTALFPLHAVLVYPADDAAMREALEGRNAP